MPVSKMTMQLSEWSQSGTWMTCCAPSGTPIQWWQGEIMQYFLFILPYLALQLLASTVSCTCHLPSFVQACEDKQCGLKLFIYTECCCYAVLTTISIGSWEHTLSNLHVPWILCIKRVGAVHFFRNESTPQMHTLEIFYINRYMNWLAEWQNEVRSPVIHEVLIWIVTCRLES